ncbi:hypothetical protein [Gracilinema caldarium]|uniref:Uncharacterized protein n=1 Tax=Gracilinema caldarium (strain ATCC 51460 / DSM 7334 / H1) TaxID=744872 RepID=F8EYZ6_GRAC1|nr:hypothetical protein [Gracilinema caldarium]AEJ19227.1 hypothetical protein Spica_1079 [Gracilinema caldarium DSM 7334]
MNVGMGGADVSLGTVAQSIAGLDAWRVNAELWTSKQDEAHKYTSGMRTLYSVGGAQELALYQELLSGKTNIEELASGDYKAKTEANGDGTKTIYLGQGALADGSRFGLNILLAHEAYRNGIDDGVEGQRIETQQAVLGHIGAAFALAQTYGMGSIGEAMTGEVNTYLEALKSNNYEALGKLLAGYDASKDYWLIKMDGTIEDTEERAFYREYIDANGNIKREKIEGSEYTGSRMLALYNFLGDKMIQKMYEESLTSPSKLATVPKTDIFSFNDKVLQDVLGWSKKDKILARKEGFCMADLTEEQKKKLVIEQLLVQNGYTYGKDIWIGTGMKVPGMKANESIGIRLVNGQWEKFTAGMEIRRDADAFDVWKNNVASNDYNVKDSADVSFYKRNLDTGVTELYNGATTNWASIDKKSSGTEVSIGGNTYKGNTIVSEWFKMHFIDYPVATYGVAYVGVLTDAQILSDTAGTQILTKAGRRTGYPTEDRWLFHSFDKGASSAGCIGPMSDINSPIIWNSAAYSTSGSQSGAYYMQQIVNQLMSQWGIYKGYEFSVHLVGQQTPTYYKY